MAPTLQEFECEPRDARRCYGRGALGVLTTHMRSALIRAHVNVGDVALPAKPLLKKKKEMERCLSDLNTHRNDCEQDAL